MNRHFDLNKLIEFARNQAVSFTVTYEESGDVCEITINSAAKAECYYEKRVYNIDEFIKRWEDHVSEAIKSQ